MGQGWVACPGEVYDSQGVVGPGAALYKRMYCLSHVCQFSRQRVTPLGMSLVSSVVGTSPFILEKKDYWKVMITEKKTYVFKKPGVIVISCRSRIFGKSV